MSAIGDYVHLLTKNYLKYGTNRYGQGQDFNIMGLEAYKKKRLGSVKPISTSTISQLEMRLRENSDFQENLDKQIVNTERQKRLDYTYDLLAETTSTENIKKFLYGNIAQPSLNLSGITEKTAELTQRKQKVQKIKELIKYFQENQTMRQDTFENKAQQLQELYKDFFNSSLKFGNFQNYQSGNLKSALGKLQDEIEAYSFNTTQSAIRGKFGEFFVASCADGIHQKSKSEAAKAIQDAVKGEKKSDITVSLHNFEGLNTSQINFIKNVDTENGTFSIGASQDKVDVQIQVKGEDVYASVKNYNLKWEGLKKFGIHLQTQRLIYTLLAMLDSGYTNHWINLHAAAVQPVHVANGFKEDVDQTVRFELIYDAFVKGNPLKTNTDTANVFVLMDSKTGTLKVINTAEILMNDALREKSFKLSHAEGLTNPNLTNEMNDGGSKYRIENILNQIHRINISVAYNVDNL